MGLKFIKPSELERNITASVHSTGKLGFTIEAAKKLKLNTDMKADIAISDDFKEDDSLYIIFHVGDSDDSYKVSKAGEYYYINIKALLSNLKVDYEGQSITYDITKENIEGQEVWKFKRRKKKDKNVEK